MYPQQSAQRPRTSGGRVVVAVLAALGILGAIGAYYVPGVLDRLGSVATDRLPFEVELLGDQTDEPSYLFPTNVRPSDLPAELLALPRRMNEFRSWATDHEAVLAIGAQIRFVLRGRTEAVVHINEVTVRVVELRPARCGWVNSWGPQGGAVSPRVLEVNLDRATEQRWSIDGEPAQRPAFTVTAADEETFDLEVSAEESEAHWVIDIAYSSAERDGQHTIDDGGKPFVLASRAAADTYESIDGEPLALVSSRVRAC
jgi:hypothetical protein